MGGVLSWGFLNYDLPLGVCEGRALAEFTIGGQLGAGGCGTVWRATDSDGKQYALKACPADHEELKFRIREVDTMHEAKGLENVVQCYDAWFEMMTPELEAKFIPEGSPCSREPGMGVVPAEYMLFLKTELCDTNLRDWLKAGNHRPSLLWRVFRQVTQGVTDLHGVEVMHRDIKPENIFLKVDPATQKVHAKLGDLGLAKSLGADGPNISDMLPFDTSLFPLTPSATRDIGTFAYMAPEQRHSRYDNKVDIYALGMLLWEMFETCDDHDERHIKLVRTRRTGRTGWWSELKTPESQHLIEHLIRPNPAERPTAAEVLHLI